MACVVQSQNETVASDLTLEPRLEKGGNECLRAPESVSYRGYFVAEESVRISHTWNRGCFAEIEGTGNQLMGDLFNALIDTKLLLDVFSELRHTWDVIETWGIFRTGYI
jgi:hypothetical protein